MSDFEGEMALITGAGKGNGRALVQAFLERGAWVAANDVSPVNPDELTQAGGGRIRSDVDDIARKVAVQRMVKQIQDDRGRIDFLINHASVEPRLPVLDMDEWEWHRVLNVNDTAAFLTMQSVGRVMREPGHGVVINVISQGGQLTHIAAHSASMAGLLALTRAAAVELEPYGIHVHALGSGCPQAD